MNSRFCMIVVSAVLGAACHAEEALSDDAAVKGALAQPWDSLTVSLRVFDGCTEPSCRGVRIIRTKAGFSITKWEEIWSGERVGVSKEFAAASLPDFIDGVLKHYAAARASDDFKETLAKMKDEKEREAALEARNKAHQAARMIGGFFVAGIDIRVSVAGAQTSFNDNYGNVEFLGLEAWLFSQTK